VTALIGSSLSRPGSIQPAGVRSSVITQPYGDFIPIDATDEYWVSVASFMREYAAGTARIKVHEYNAAKQLLASTEIATITAAEDRWTRHLGHFGPEATVTRTAWNAATAWLKLDAYADGNPDMTWELDAWQVERGPHPTAYAPRPQELINSQIDREEIADLAIVGPKIEVDAVTETKIAPDSISTPKLQANAVTAQKVAAEAIETNHLAAGAVTAEKVSANAIETNHLAAGSVNADKIQAGAIESDKIAAAAIVTGKIASNVSATGMLVISAADGTTVILDGSSNMFKITATGTMSHTQGATSGGSSTVDLTGLGALPTTPAHLCFVSEGNATSSHQHGFRFIETADVFVSGTSGGSPTQRTRTINWQGNMIVLLATGAIARVLLGVDNSTGVSKTAYGRYYVLKEAAL
jgi:hypothetical protein